MRNYHYLNPNIEDVLDEQGKVKVPKEIKISAGTVKDSIKQLEDIVPKDYDSKDWIVVNILD